MNHITDTDHSGTNANSRAILLLYIACGWSVGLIFLLDLIIPLGAAMAVAYSAVVLITLWSPRKRLTIFVAIICSLLTIGAFYLQPQVPELWKVIFNRAMALFVTWATALLVVQRKRIEQDREKAVRERGKALEDVRVLRGLLPICASCKSIRNDQGLWTRIEEYIRDHSEADFSHGICPECAKKLYPDYYKEKD